MSDLTITVYGLPAPQGSKRHVGHGIMIESSKNVKPWREAVKWAAIAQAKTVDIASPFFDVTAPERNRMICGPVTMDVTFTLPRPKKYARKLNVPPSAKPDLSKLVRSTEDALTDAGAWEDDARVVECTARKVYPGQHPYALDVPGAYIRLSMVRG